MVINIEADIDGTPNIPTNFKIVRACCLSKTRKIPDKYPMPKIQETGNTASIRTSNTDNKSVIHNTWLKQFRENQFTVLMRS